jgi:tetratricopeptide (TPR) repeat protein
MMPTVADQHVADLSRGQDILPTRTSRLSQLLAALVVALLGLSRPGSGAAGGDGVVTTPMNDTFSRGREAYRRGDFETALRLFRRAADEGYAPAMSYLADMYGKGEGTPPDFVAARQWYEEAWERGADKWAAYRLGLIYENGLGVEKNSAIADFWNALASGFAATCD